MICYTNFIFKSGICVNFIEKYYFRVALLFCFVGAGNEHAITMDLERVCYLRLQAGALQVVVVNRTTKHANTICSDEVYQNQLA